MAVLGQALLCFVMVGFLLAGGATRCNCKQQHKRTASCSLKKILINGANCENYLSRSLGAIKALFI